MTVREVPASVGQRLLWALDRARGGSTPMSCPMVCRIHGAVTPAALDAAVTRLAARHEALRTTFAGGRRLMQVIHPAAPVHVEYAELSGEGAAERALGRELATRIDPCTTPLRATAWRTGERDRLLCLNMPHLVADTWSCAILLRELAASLDGAADGAALPPVGWQYRDFAAWQERRLSGDRLRAQHEHWRRALAGVEPVRLPRRAGPAVPGGWVSTEAGIDSAATACLRRLAHAHRTTLFAVLLAVFYGVLHVTAGQRDLAVASPFANRTRHETQGTVGHLVNVVVLRTRLPARPTFADVLRRSRVTVLDAVANQELPYHVLAPLGAGAGAGAGRPDAVAFQLLTAPIDAALRAGELEVQGLVPDVAGRFPLELAVMARGDALAAKVFAAADVMAPPQARDLMDAYVAAAVAVGADPDAPLVCRVA
jgi:Condensation domain